MLDTNSIYMTDHPRRQSLWKNEFVYETSRLWLNRKVCGRDGNIRDITDFTPGTQQRNILCFQDCWHRNELSERLSYFDDTYCVSAGLHFLIRIVEVWLWYEVPYMLSPFLNLYWKTKKIDKIFVSVILHKKICIMKYRMMCLLWLKKNHWSEGWWDLYFPEIWLLQLRWAMFWNVFYIYIYFFHICVWVHVWNAAVLKPCVCSTTHRMFEIQYFTCCFLFCFMKAGHKMYMNYV